MSMTGVLSELFNWVLLDTQSSNAICDDFPVMPCYVGRASANPFLAAIIHWSLK